MWRVKLGSVTEWRGGEGEKQQTLEHGRSNQTEKGLLCFACQVCGGICREGGRGVWMRMKEEKIHV